jgi:hypothetical protein
MLESRTCYLLNSSMLFYIDIVVVAIIERGRQR